MDPAGELAQLLQPRLELGARADEHHRRVLGAVDEAALGHSQGERGGDQPLLGAVVQVALDAAPRLVGGGDDPRPRRLELGRARGRGLRAQPRLLGGAPPRDVEDDPVEALAPERVDRAQAAIEDPPHLPRRGDDPVLENVRVAGRERVRDVAVHPLAVFLVDDGVEAAAGVADEVAHRISGDPLDLVADELHREVGIDVAAVDRARDVAHERGDEPLDVRDRVRHDRHHPPTVPRVRPTVKPRASGNGARDSFSSAGNEGDQQGYDATFSPAAPARSLRSRENSHHGRGGPPSA